MALSAATPQLACYAAFLAAHLFFCASAIFLRVAALKGLRLTLGAVDVDGLACVVVDAIHFGGRPLRLPLLEARR